MKTTLSLTVLMLFAGASVTAGALGLKGENALSDVTTDLLTLSSADCGGVTQPSGNLAYEGGGSLAGQASLAAGLQQVAPMARALGAEGSLCAIANPRLATAEGMVFGLDGVSIVANAGLWQTCNAVADPTCLPQPALGLVHDRVVTPDPARTCSQDSDCNTAGIFGEACTAGVCTYSLASWKEALRILFAGQSAPGHNLAQRNCNSPERRYLANNWNRLFATCSEASCPAGVQHAFRLSDTAGATSVFVDLLDLPIVDPAANLSPFCNVSTKGPAFFVNPNAPATCTVDTDCAPPGGTAPAGTCNAGACEKCQVLSNVASADLNSGILPTPLSGYAAIAPPSGVAIITTYHLGGIGRYVGPDWPEFQDRDVIRRSCAFPSEDVCSARGDLGLVLPVADVREIGAEAFPTEPCQTGKFGCFMATKINGESAGAVYAPCPDGADPNLSGNQCPRGQCAFPVRVVTGGPIGPLLDPRCVQPSRTNSPSGDINIAAGAKVDARVYNLTTWSADPSTPGLFVKATVTRPTGLTAACISNVASTAKVSMVGAYYRIHSSHALKSANGAPNLCRQLDGSAQIGCLVQASPCSVGFAGRSAANVAVNGAQDAIALKVNGVDPAEACLRGLVTGGPTYPLTHKLYVNSTLGFGSVTGSERKLSACFAQRPLIDPVLTSRGMTTLSVTPSDRPVYCEDFIESAACGVGVNANACKDSPSNGAPIPSCEIADDPATCTVP